MGHHSGRVLTDCTPGCWAYEASWSEPSDRTKRVSCHARSRVATRPANAPEIAGILSLVSLVRLASNIDAGLSSQATGLKPQRWLSAENRGGQPTLGGVVGPLLHRETTQTSPAPARAYQSRGRRTGLEALSTQPPAAEPEAA